MYKKDAIREATMSKYIMTQKWLEKLVPELKVSELSRTAYQQLLNDYAKEILNGKYLTPIMSKGLSGKHDKPFKLIIF